MNGLKKTCAAVAAIAFTAGLAAGQGRIGLGGVRSGQPRTNGFQGGPPVPPAAPVQPRPDGRIGFPRSPRDSGWSRGPSGGGGARVDGRFDDDTFRMRFHLGSDLGAPNRWWDDGGDRRHGDWRDDGHDWWRRRGWPRRVIVWPYYYGNYGSYGIGWPYGNVYDPYLTRPTYDYPPPPREQPPALENLSPRELGALALRTGEPEAAIEAYRKHLDESPEDADAMRRLGVAMIDARKIRDGVAMIALAYRTDPRLCGKELPRTLVGGAADLRTLVNRASIYANTTGSASAWLAMAVLAQAEGRDHVAARMVERARDAGLDPALADKFIAALGQFPSSPRQ
ncbi:MAG: hypothetical protein IT437_12750 [Phycisphaerales bacterium]|nr:hypothetical protein [Phycisphaerales bacterium]